MDVFCNSWKVWLGLAVVSAGCVSSPPRDGTQLWDFGPRDAQRLEQIEREIPGSDPVAALIALAEIPEPIAGTLLGETPVLASFAVPTHELAVSRSRGAQEVCAAELCAGVAMRGLDPNDFDLPAWPSCPLLRALTGTSQPPLAGWGGRLRRNPFGVAVRWLFRRQYYSHLFEDSRGTLDDETVNNAKALVLLDREGQKLVWVKADLIGAFQDLRSEIISRLHARGLTDVHDGNFLFHGSHTHSGLGAVNPRLFFQLATLDLFSEPLFDAVAESAVEAVLAAEASLEPARLGSGVTHVTGITENRRETCPGDPPDTEPDSEVGILRVERADGTALATVLNFAIHGTSLEADNLSFSPDNMGYAESWIEDHAGGTALFFNGAEGDVKPTGGDVRAVGETLGQAVLEALGEIEISDRVDFNFRYCQLDDPAVPPEYPVSCPELLEPFQLRPFKFIEVSPGCYRDRDGGGWAITVDKADDPPVLEREGVVLGAFRIDVHSGAGTKRTLVMTLPGEPITDIGLALKTAAHGLSFDHAWVFGLTNAHMGYVVTEEEYLQGGYEAGANVFGPSEGRVFVDNILFLARQLAP